MTEKQHYNNAHSFMKAKENYKKMLFLNGIFKIIIEKDGKIVETFTSITNPSSKRFINFIENQIKS